MDQWECGNCLQPTTTLPCGHCGGDDRVARSLREARQVTARERAIRRSVRDIR